MSKTAKIVVAVLVVAGIAYGVYYWYTKNKKPVVPAVTTAADPAKATVKA